MKINSLFTNLFFVISSVGFCQVSPYGFEMDSIKFIVEESKQELIELNKDFLNPDSMIVFPDTYWIYYGSAFLESYSPYGEGSQSEINLLWEEEKYEEIINLSKETFLSNPGSVKPLYNISVSYDVLGDSVLAGIYYDKYLELLSVPFYSGTGESTDNAYVVRCTTDEYLILNELGYTSHQQSLIFDKDIPYDILYVRDENKTEEELKEVHFNIYQPYILGMKNMFKPLSRKEKRKKRKEKRKEKKLNK